MNKTAKQYQQCLAGQVHNPGKKSILVPRDLRPPFSGPLEHLKLNFIQLPLNMVYKYVLVINICMFSP